jgi:hypothetical protein
MRQASPTGGALGGVAVEELKMLQSALGNLDTNQSPEKFANELRKVKNVVSDIVHGPGKGPRETVEADPTAPKAKSSDTSDVPAAPTGVDPKIWKHMTPEERALFGPKK